ncbi:hypothetical protein [Gloeocapsopsis dulcis]|uniref:SWIM-type domain-containing protein n=1 Tax=Gloeocapsopsis dulcis AAB1 = 1H9 TaxID=1433147 RepID=A0A6N8G374_9CHRO|nr:hypothetical protein [Gloeocapsopsis dulcis]MUL39374.1 hypothetical protein [Gloeocapsopsis dulcis AAB1 = 1H9]WNN92230.1 hypothetical protein P0S91_27085 [Gloeocapsopsis dulcis]
MIEISSELASQHISRYAIADLLCYLNRTKWEQKYNRYQLKIELWAVGIWVREAGIISYQGLACFIRETTLLKASHLQVEQRSPNLFLVQGVQKSKYAVVRQHNCFCCECMLYRCRHNRLKKELPQLFEALNRKIFCHHTVAAYLSLKTQ